MTDFVRSKYFVLSVSLVFLFLLLGVNFSFHKIGDYRTETDFYGQYAPEARSIIQGRLAIDDYRGPIYPLCLAGLYLVFKDFFKAGIFIGSLSAALILFLVFKLLRDVFDEGRALFSAGLLILNPVFFQYTYSAGTDMFFNLLAMLILYSLLKNPRFKYRKLIGISLMTGLAYLTRYNGLSILLAAVVVIIFIDIWNLPLKKRLGIVLLYFGIFFAVISPWGVYCANKKGSFIYNKNYLNTAYEFYGKDEIPYEDFWFGQREMNIHSFVDVILYKPPLFMKKLAENLILNFARDMESLLGLHLGLFVLLGIFGAFFTYCSRRQWAFYICSFSFYGMLIFVSYRARFSLFLIPCYLVLAFSGIQLITKKFSSKKVRDAIILAMFIWTATSCYVFNKKTIGSGPLEVKQIAEFYNLHLRQLQPGKIISARKPHIAYYTQMEFRVIPVAINIEDLIAKLKVIGADYLFISQIECSTRKNLTPLLNPQNAIAGLFPAYSVTNPRAVLYHIRK